MLPERLEVLLFFFYFFLFFSSTILRSILGDSSSPISIFWFRVSSNWQTFKLTYSEVLGLTFTFFLLFIRRSNNMKIATTPKYKILLRPLSRTAPGAPTHTITNGMYHALVNKRKILFLQCPLFFPSQPLIPKNF